MLKGLLSWKGKALLTSSIDPPAALVTYMSKKALDVAHANTALDLFVQAAPLLAKTVESVGWKFDFHTLVASTDWLRVRNAQDTAYSTYVVGANGFDFGGFEFANPAPDPPLETQALSPEDRLELEKLEMF